MLFKYYILFSINFSFIAFGLQFGFHGISRSVPQLYSSETTSIKDQWFEQRVDHFDPQNNRTFKQRYFINDTFYDKKDGPIFLLIHGEQEASATLFNGLQMTSNFAKRFKAMSVLLEHRFYGKSRPFDDLATDNLRYLTSQQALQDTAFFIEYLNDKMSLNGSQWIVFGGSYAGALAAWFQAKYPHLSSGAVASSAPMKAVVSFTEYLEVVIKALGKSCNQYIREAFTQLEAKTKTQKGCEEIEKKFKLCAPLVGTDSDEVNHLMWTFATQVINTVQYDTKREGDSMFEGSESPKFPNIDDICHIMTNTSDNALERLSRVSQMISNYFNEKCIDFKYDKFITNMSNTDWNVSPAGLYRQWYYQTCAEFGWYITTDNNKESPFLDYLSAKYYIKRCTDIYGPKFTEASVEKSVAFTNNYYGGYDIHVRKVLFPNGATDPVKALGFLKDHNEEAKALVIEGASHCSDMLPDSDDDIQALKDARKVIADAIGEFLGKPVSSGAVSSMNRRPFLGWIGQLFS